MIKKDQKVVNTITNNLSSLRVKNQYILNNTWKPEETSIKDDVDSEYKLWDGPKLFEVFRSIKKLYINPLS